MRDLNYFTEERNTTIDSPVARREMSKTFLSSVFGYMFVALAITGVTAWYFAYSRLLEQYLYNAEGQPTPVLWIAMFAPLGLVFWMSLGFNKLKPTTMLIIFIAYALINGIAFSTIFIAYDLGAIYKAFFSAAGVFAAMSVVGYTTKTDLTKLGSILTIGLFVMIGAMLLNWFMASPMMDYIISVAGVIIFTGLTAYDVQKLKNIGQGVNMGDASTRKLIIHGALSLYLDFINLFLFLLRLFASRD